MIKFILWDPLGVLRGFLGDPSQYPWLCLLSVWILAPCGPWNFLLYCIVETRSLWVLGACTNIYLILLSFFPSSKGMWDQQRELQSLYQILVHSSIGFAPEPVGLPREGNKSSSSRASRQRPRWRACENARSQSCMASIRHPRLWRQHSQHQWERPPRGYLPSGSAPVVVVTDN